MSGRVRRTLAKSVAFKYCNEHILAVMESEALEVERIAMLGRRLSPRRDPFLVRLDSRRCSGLLKLSHRSKIVSYEKTNTLESVSVSDPTTLCWCAGIWCFVGKRAIY
jgi:hypothetical protein